MTIILRDGPPIKVKPRPLILVKSPVVIRPRPKLVIPPPTFQHTSPVDPGFSVDERTQQILDQIREEADMLDDDGMRELWLDGVQTFAQTGEIDKLLDLTEYRRRVVPLDEYMFDDAYLGMKLDETYPGVIEACEALDTGNYVEAVLKGALGGGKSTIGNIMMSRVIYRISCMRHPQSSFGIRSGSSLVITIQSIRLATAKKAVFDEFGGFIHKSPYFRTIYPYDRQVTSQMIFREQNLSVLPVASSSTGAISMNVIGGILDEMNFMLKIKKSKSSNSELDGSFDQAKNTYNAIARRRRSRFSKKGKLPGILFLISSSRFPDDFTEMKAAESTMMGGTDPNIYVFSKSVWESKRRDQFMDETFDVMVGNAVVRSKILREGEMPHPDCRVIPVPMDFVNEFTSDPDGSLRDFAGITIMATRPFITRREAIFNCMEYGAQSNFKSPFPSETYDFSLGIPRPNRSLLRTDIKMFRAAHIDLGLKRDACGIAIGHIAGQKLIERTDPVTGVTHTEIMPIIAYDAILRVVPPPNGEIEFAQIREFLIMMRDEMGLPIEYVTTDGFQSVDCRQILFKLGFKTDYLSVEKMDPYRSLRDALYDTRIQLMQHQWLVNELSGLEYVQAATGDKVDHRANGTKDVADAVCGVTAFLLKRRVAWSGIIQKQSHAGQQEEQKPKEEPKPLKRIRPINIRKSVFRRAIARR